MSEKLTSPTTSLLKRAPWALVIGEEPLNSDYAKMAVFASKLRNVNFGITVTGATTPKFPHPNKSVSRRAAGDAERQLAKIFKRSF